MSLIGTFVFINNGYGILSGMYHNTTTSEPFPETAKRISNRLSQINTDPFDGLYKTIWLEPTQQDTSDLEIERIADGSYKLKWYDSIQNYFEGIGFLRNGELIGSYWESIKNSPAIATTSDVNGNSVK